MNEKICGNCGTCSYKGRNLNFDIPEETKAEPVVSNTEEAKEHTSLTEVQRNELAVLMEEAILTYITNGSIKEAMAPLTESFLDRITSLKSDIRSALGYEVPKVEGLDPSLIKPACSEEVLNLVLDAASKALQSTVESSLLTAYYANAYTIIQGVLEKQYPRVDTDKLLIRSEGAAPTEYEILRFISSFSEAEDFFTLGKCYWFAQILNTRFRDCVIYYAPADNHWITRIGEYYYDASGKVKASNFQNLTRWEDYKKQEPKHARRLLKQCACYDWSDYGG